MSGGRVDVVVPNYNYGAYLEACVRSVLAQDIGGLRVLIVDNASTDESPAIARRLAAEDPRVELRLRSENCGPHASFNEGIDWAEADYMLILCSDDMLVPGALRRAAAVLDTDERIAFVYGLDVQITGDEDHVDLPAPAEPVALQRMSGAAFIERFCRLGVFQLPGQTLVVRTSVHKRAGHYRPELPHSDDYDVWLRLATFGDVVAMDCVQAVNRRHGNNRSEHAVTRQLNHIRDSDAAARCFFAHPEGAGLNQAATLRRLADRGIAERAYWAGLSALLRGEAAGLELIGFALRRRPSMALLPPLAYLGQRPDTRRRLSGLLSGLSGRTPNRA